MRNTLLNSKSLVPEPKIAALSLIALALAGCATVPETPQVADTYCLTAKKIRWSVEDTPETVRQVEIINKTIDAKCRPRKS
jgi:starvation-inducible outer membrane lipoprotein